MVGDFIIRKHSARTADATLTLARSLLLAHSLCSHGLLNGVALLQIRTLPMDARGDARTANATLALAHAPVGRTGS